jgi:hypothetical protein
MYQINETGRQTNDRIVRFCILRFFRLSYFDIVVIAVLLFLFVNFSLCHGDVLLVQDEIHCELHFGSSSRSYVCMCENKRARFDFALETSTL